MLANFILSTILFTFPQSRCDGMCSIEVESHQCSDIKEMTCCDMMDMNNTNSTPCGMEITDNSCDYIIDVIDDITFLVPKTIDTNIELLEIALIITSDIEKTPRLLIKSQNTLLDSSPPIYLAISSFLI
ncbi:MAG: hypothetical protein OQJ81_03650 [Melioribacteraceae bacterium]|nr:hypothetical protein [Melioribacteraceae bacterium]